MYLTPGVPLERAEALAKEWGEDPMVASVRVISAETALADLGRDAGFAGALTILTANPCPTLWWSGPAPGLILGRFKNLPPE